MPMAIVGVGGCLPYGRKTNHWGQLISIIINLSKHTLQNYFKD